MKTLHNAKPRINKQGQANSCLLAVERGAQPEQRQAHRIHIADPRLESVVLFLMYVVASFSSFYTDPISREPR